MKGLDQFKHPTMNTLPLVLRGASKIGWYEGSGFFVIMSKYFSFLFFSYQITLSDTNGEWRINVLIILLFSRHPQLQMVSGWSVRHI